MMLRYLIHHVKLRDRIFLGYILSTGFLLSVIILAYFSLKTISKEFGHFTDTNQHSQIDLVITQNISEIQRQAMIYTYDGQESAAQSVHTLYIHTMQLLGHEREGGNPRLEVIERHLKNYFQAFQEAEIQRKRRKHLVTVNLREKATDVENLLTRYINHIEHYDEHVKVETQKILTSMLQVEKNAFRYYDSLDSQYISLAQQNLHEAVQGTDALLKFDPHLEGKEQLSGILSALQQYESTFVESIQRTRGYLFLVNVVMAAEAYEILYNAKNIRNELRHSLKESEKGILLSIDHIMDILVITAISIVLLSFLISRMIARSITEPIIKLAQTFQNLAEGSQKTQIPLYSQNDEIGHLSGAAEVFLEKNIQTEELLEHSKSLTTSLERSNEELEQFVYTVSHDLKSPIVTSTGFISIIHHLVQEGKWEEAIQKLDRVEKSNDRMAQLINDLLELSRVGRIDLDTELIDLNLLLHQFKDAQKDQLAKRDFTMIIHAGLPHVQANESRILQVFENLLSNAYKYAANPSGSRIEIGSRPGEETYLIYFKDNGMGIAPEYHQKIFALFYRLGNTQQEGTGIGLAVAKKVMKFHGGDIWVESEKGKGATFWLQFPIEKASVEKMRKEERDE